MSYRYFCQSTSPPDCRSFTVNYSLTLLFGSISWLLDQNRWSSLSSLCWPAYLSIWFYAFTSSAMGRYCCQLTTINRSVTPVQIINSWVVKYYERLDSAANWNNFELDLKKYSYSTLSSHNEAKQLWLCTISVSNSLRTRVCFETSSSFEDVSEQWSSIKFPYISISVFIFVKLQWFYEHWEEFGRKWKHSDSICRQISCTMDCV